MDKIWFKSAIVRAIKTAAQTALGVIGASVAMSDVDWVLVGSASLLAAITSIVTSIAGLPEVEAKKELNEIRISQSGRIYIENNKEE